MVMPRSRSRSMESRTCSCISRCESAPVISSKRSASVDLPWSMCAMMQKFRMNFGSIFLAYQFSQLRAGFEWPARFFRRACCFRTSDTCSVKTVPCKQPVCHNSNGASACPIIQAKRNIVWRERARRRSVSTCDAALCRKGLQLSRLLVVMDLEFPTRALPDVEELRLTAMPMRGVELQLRAVKRERRVPIDKWAVDYRAA